MEPLHIEHPRTLPRLVGAALVLAGIGGAMLVTSAVRAAEEGVYSEAAATRITIMGSAASILVLGGIGMVLFTMRRAVRVDPEERTVSVSWSALGVQRHRALPLDPEGMITLAQREQPAGSSTIIVIAVEYVHPRGWLELSRSTDYAKARSFGERFAAACGLRLAGLSEEGEPGTRPQ